MKEKFLPTDFKKMKTLFFSLILTIYPFLSKAQAIHTGDKWIEKALDKIKNQKNACLVFSYQERNLPTFKKGKLFLSKDRYKLFLDDNFIQICDGEKVYTINPQSKEITITHKDLSGSLSPIAMLDIYKVNFIPEKGMRKKYRSKDKEDKIIQVIKLSPKGESGYEGNFSVEIDISNFQIYQLIGHNMNEFFRLIIESWKENEKLKESLFEFDKKKYEELGYTITELD